MSADTTCVTRPAIDKLYATADEETTCRFCHEVLADWKNVMTESTGSRVVTPYMRISFNGRTHKVAVRPGHEGSEDFQREIKRLLQLPEDQQFDVIFHCRAPGTGKSPSKIELCSFDGLATLSPSGGCAMTCHLI
jgi:hypothetical protein